MHARPPPPPLQTSMFNVKTALQDNQQLFGIDELLDYANDRCGLRERTMQARLKHMRRHT